MPYLTAPPGRAGPHRRRGSCPAVPGTQVGATVPTEREKTMAASTTRQQLQHCLSDVDYPAGKDMLVAAAESADCDEDTVRALRAIPPVTYANSAEVLASVSTSDDRLGDSEKARARRTHTTPGLAENAKDLPLSNPIVEELGENRKRIEN